jgi:outer membrane lipoprotein carrier protein
MTFAFLLASVLAAATAAGAGGAPASVPRAVTGAGGAPAAAPAARLELAAVVDRVQKRYDGATDFRARFTQTLTNATFKRRTTATGEVLLKKPGRMRWNYETPDPKMYLSDGTQLWLYEPEDKQAFKQDLKSSQLPAALAFLTGTGKLAEQFEISFVRSPRAGTPQDYVLALSPRQAEAQVKGLEFVIDPQSFLVKETVITDANGNTNNMLFSDIKINGRIPDSTFRWSPPAGTRVIDAGKLTK